MEDPRPEPAGAREDVTGLFLSWRRGEPQAFNVLFEQLYDELRKLAHAQRARARPGETLHTTALVHEAYLRLIDSTRVDVREREHFLALAARAMRFVLVDAARERMAKKRGGDQQHVELHDVVVVNPAPTAEQLLIVDRALDRLSGLDARQAQVFEMRAFGGLSVDETASVLEVSPKTVKRDWRKARMFLTRELAAGNPP